MSEKKKLNLDLGSAGVGLAAGVAIVSPIGYALNKKEKKQKQTKFLN